MQAAIEQARKTYPEFHEGAAAYGRYYWHTFADSGVENYLVGAIFPSITHEDPRYYTLGRGQVLERVRYAVSRLWITRSDAREPQPSISRKLLAAACQPKFPVVITPAKLAPPAKLLRGGRAS